MSRTLPRPSSFKPGRCVSTTVVWLTLRTSDLSMDDLNISEMLRDARPGTAPLLELQGVQPPVDSLRGQQFPVGPRLAHLPLVHHDDPVGGQDRRQPMGDDEGGPPGAGA